MGVFAYTKKQVRGFAAKASVNFIRLQTFRVFVFTTVGATDIPISYN